MEIIGMMFGATKVISQISKRGKWLCECECGKRFSAVTSRLTRIKSCGCKRIAATIERSFRHGEAKRKSKTPEYQCWSGMIKRCTNPNASDYYLYGARGIKVCDEWISDYAAFLAHVGRRPTVQHSIDRYPDNDGDYRPGNVRWATAEQQSRNRRNLSKINFRGREMLLVEAVELVNGNYDRTIARIASGWPMEKAITAPRDPRGSKRSRS